MNTLDIIADELHRHWIDSVSQEDKYAAILCSCGETIKVPYGIKYPDPSMEFTVHCAQKLLGMHDLIIRARTDQ